MELNTNPSFNKNVLGWAEFTILDMEKLPILLIFLLGKALMPDPF